MLALNKRMAEKNSLTFRNKLTPYEIGLKIKALLDDKAKTNDILETVSIKGAQLTTYKKIIKNGRLEDLKTGSVRKILAEEKSLERSKKCRQNEAIAQSPLSPVKNEGARVEANKGPQAGGGEPKQSEATGHRPSMINEIENDGKNANEDINLEYFVGGQKKYFVPYQNHHNLSDKFSKEILIAENMLLRIRLKNEMGKRIEE